MVHIKTISLFALLQSVLLIIGQLVCACVQPYTLIYVRNLQPASLAIQISKCNFPYKFVTAGDRHAPQHTTQVHRVCSLSLCVWCVCVCVCSADTHTEAC